MRYLFGLIANFNRLFFAPDGNTGGADDQAGNTDDQNQDQEPVQLTSEKIDQIFDDESYDQDLFLEKLKSGKPFDLDTIKKKPATTPGADKTADPDKTGSENIADNKPAADESTNKPNNESVEPKPTDMVKLDDNFINSRPEEEKKYLDGVKGHSMTYQVYKNYVNAQQLIDKAKNYSPQPETKQLSTTEIIIPDSSKVQKDAIESDRIQYVLTALKGKYPDVPDDILTNEESYDAYFKTLWEENSGKARRFEDQYKATTSKSYELANQYVDMATNWETNAARAIRNEVEAFKNYLKEYNVTTEELGINIDLDEGNKNPFLYQNIIFPGNKANPDVVTFYNNDIPMIIPQSIFNGLTKTLFPKILQLQNAKARKEGYLQRVDDDTPPSLSDSSTPAHKDSKLEPGSSFDNEDADLADIEKDLQRIKDSVRGR